MEIRARRFAAHSPMIGVHIPLLTVDDYDVQLAKIDEIYQAGVAQYRLPDGQVKMEMRQVTVIRPIEPGRPLSLRIDLKKLVDPLTVAVYHLSGELTIPVPPEE